MKYILAIDAGTTGVTVVLVDKSGRIIRSANAEFSQIYPKPGWVEHNAAEIWETTRKLLNKIVSKPADIAAIGVTNQRETTVIWNRITGKPIHNAIVWQCRRTSDACAKLRKRGLEKIIRKKTGLIIDPYFSATKIQWLFENVRPKGDLCFGTIDSWLIYKLTGGKTHATDHTNASRTMLYNIDRREWDKDLLKIFKIPASILP